jgi:hypothetical protein
MPRYGLRRQPQQAVRYGLSHRGPRALERKPLAAGHGATNRGRLGVKIDETANTRALGIRVSDLLGMTAAQVADSLDAGVCALCTPICDQRSEWALPIMQVERGKVAGRGDDLVRWNYLDAKGQWKHLATFSRPSTFESWGSVPGYVFTRRPADPHNGLIRPVVYLMFERAHLCHRATAHGADVQFTSVVRSYARSEGA